VTEAVSIERIDVVQPDIADPVWRASWKHMIGSAGSPIEIRHALAGHRSPPRLRADTHRGEHSESEPDHEERLGSSEVAIPKATLLDANAVGKRQSRCPDMLAE
jgi:hypothetical protein